MHEKVNKNAQKAHFPTKAITQYFQKYVRYASNALGGIRNTSHRITLKLLPTPQPTQ